MTARRLRGLDAIRDAAIASPPAIHVLELDGVPRVGLTPREVAMTTAISYRRILNEITAGQIRVIGGGREYVIPVSELASIVARADYLSATA